MIDVSVIIVNYNTADLISNCLQSVLCQRNVNIEVIAVDNNSRDASLDVLHSFGDKIKIIANKDNKGFGRANNQAFAECEGRYLCLLNPDAVFLTDLDLFHLTRFMDKHQDYGLLGTRIINRKNRLEKTAFDHYPRQKHSRVDFSNLPGTLAAVLGASMFVRRDVFAEIRGFDEDYFLYAEETDLCLRIRKAGGKIGYCDQVTVRHIGSASERGNPSTEIMRKKKLGKYLFYRKHYPIPDVIKIAKNDLRSARRKLWPLRCLRLIYRLNPGQAEDYARYSVSYSIAKQLLMSLK